MPGAPTIATMSGLVPMRAVKVRSGDLYLFDGTSRPVRWDGVAASGWPAGVDPPLAGPTILPITLNGGTTEYSVSTPHGLSVGATVVVAGTTVSGYNISQTVTAVADEQDFT